MRYKRLKINKYTLNNLIMQYILYLCKNNIEYLHKWAT